MSCHHRHRFVLVRHSRCGNSIVDEPVRRFSQFYHSTLNESGKTVRAASCLWDHGPQVRIPQSGCVHLIFTAIGTSKSTQVTAGPGLCSQPTNRWHRCHPECPQLRPCARAFRFVLGPDVLNGDNLSLSRKDVRRRILAAVIVLVAGCPNQSHRLFASAAFRKIEVR